MSEMDQLLAGYSYDEGEVWQLYLDAFQRRSAADREAQLLSFDKFVSDTDGMSTLSRSAAELLVRKRALLDAHAMLRQLGR